MTEREIIERLLELAQSADKLCLPGHRVTADHVYERQDVLRTGIRRLYRDLTGIYPERASATHAPHAPPAGSRSPPQIRVWRA